MELQQLRYFDEVARTQHVTNSAKKLNVAQPALTQSIRRLERELGVTLFERVGRNVRLTACGDALQKRVAPLLAALDELPEELAVVAGQQRAASILQSNRPRGWRWTPSRPTAWRIPTHVSW